MFRFFRIRVFFYFLLFNFMLTVFYARGEVYQLTNSSTNDASSKLIIDKNGDIWCFWIEYEEISVQGKSHLRAKYFHNGAWSEQISVFDSSAFQYVFDYDIDVDREQNIWVSFSNGSYLCLLKQEEDRTFRLKGVLDGETASSMGITYSLTMAASDSDQVYIDAFYLDDIYGLKLLYFSDGQFEIIDNTEQSCIVHVQEWSVNALKARWDKIYFVTNEYSRWDGNKYFEGIIYPVSVYPEFHAPAYSENINISYWSETGIDDNGNLYVFNKSDPDKKQECRLKLYDTQTDQVIKEWGRVNFSPELVSKHGAFLALAWMEENKLFFKGIKDSILYKTTMLPEDTSHGSYEKRLYSIQPDSFPRVWVTWKTKISNQDEIFTADCMLNTEIDTNAVLALPAEQVRIKSFKLLQNYPNPFNPLTHIKYTLPFSGRVDLSLYNLLGQKIETLVNEHQQSGTHTALLDGSNLPSGIYMYRIQTSDGFVQSKKCILIK